MLNVMAAILQLAALRTGRLLRGFLKMLFLAPFVTVKFYCNAY